MTSSYFDWESYINLNYLRVFQATPVSALRGDEGVYLKALVSFLEEIKWALYQNTLVTLIYGVQIRSDNLSWENAKYYIAKHELQLSESYLFIWDMLNAVRASIFFFDCVLLCDV